MTVLLYFQSILIIPSHISLHKTVDQIYIKVCYNNFQIFLSLCHLYIILPFSLLNILYIQLKITLLIILQLYNNLCHTLNYKRAYIIYSLTTKYFCTQIYYSQIRFYLPKVLTRRGKALESNNTTKQFAMICVIGVS